MTNDDILKIAMEQSAFDANCQSSDFMADYNVIVYSKKNPEARKYIELPFICDLISYGTNIVASIDSKYEDIVRKYIDTYSVEHCFETPNMHVLNREFMKHNMKVCFMAEYFLPDINNLSSIKCKY